MFYQWLMNFHICIMYHASTSWIVATQLADGKVMKSGIWKHHLVHVEKLCAISLGATIRYYKYTIHPQYIYHCRKIPSDLALHCFQNVDVSENVVYPIVPLYPMVFMIIILIKWLAIIGNINPTFSVTNPCESSMFPPIISSFPTAPHRWGLQSRHHFCGQARPFWPCHRSGVDACTIGGSSTTAEKGVERNHMPIFDTSIG